MRKQAMEMTEQTARHKTYTQEQVAQLIALKDQTIRWLNHERQNLEIRGTKLRNSLTKVDQAANQIEQLSNERKDLAVFEMMRL
jgi:hypothetical protein